MVGFRTTLYVALTLVLVLVLAGRPAHAQDLEVYTFDGKQKKLYFRNSSTNCAARSVKTRALPILTPPWRGIYVIAPI